jgi:hypothetical protein
VVLGHLASSPGLQVNKTTVFRGIVRVRSETSASRLRRSNRCLVAEARILVSMFGFQVRGGY